MAELTMPIDNRVMQNITIKVRLARTFRIRMWLGAQLMRLGAAIVGCSIELVSPSDE